MACERGGRRSTSFLTRLMVPSQILKQIRQGVPDPIADDPGEADLAHESKIAKLPGIEVQQFGGLFFREGEFSVDQVVQAGHLVHDSPNDLLNHGPDFISAQLKVCHNITHAWV